MVWSDARGLWSAQPPAHEKKLLNNYILKSDYKDGEDLIGQYRFPFWSPTSRYLVLDRSVFIEGGDKVLLDIQNGNLVRLPNTYEYAGYHPLHVTWLDDERLSIISGYLATVAPSADIWQIDPENPNLLVRESTFDLGLLCSIVSNTGLIDRNQVYYLIFHIPGWDEAGCLPEVDYGLHFATSPGSYTTSWIETPERKTDFVDFVWSPDYEFAVMSLENRSEGGSYFVELLNIEGEVVDDATPIIGDSEDICCFTWVE